MVGIVLLYKSKGEELQNQRIITLNLAVAEMLYCLLNVINSFVYLLESSVPFAFSVTMHCIFAALFCIIRFAYLHIIVDRFLDIRLNIKYPLYMSSKKMKVIITSQWIFGFTITVTIMLLTFFNVSKQGTASTASFYLDIIILIVAVSNFIYLFVKVKSIANEDTRQGREQNRTRNIWFRFKVPVLMILTFIVFNVSAGIWYYLDPKVVEDEKNYAHTLLRIFGWSSDAVIYIFLQKRVRGMLVLNCCRGANENRVAVI